MFKSNFSSLKINLLKISFDKKLRFSTIETRKIVYSIFGVEESFSEKDLKKKYFELCKKTHPDVEGGSNVKFLEIQKAYEIISDPIRLKKYKEMNLKEHKDFNEQWNITYGEENEKIEELNKKIKSVKNEKSIFNPLKYIDMLINKYNLIIYEKKIHEKEKILYQSYKKKISFLLDTSGSMYSFNVNEINQKNIKFKVHKYGHNLDGCSTVEYVTFDQKYEDIVENAVYINKCVKSINSLVSSLNENYKISLSTFSDDYDCVILNSSPISFDINEKMFKKGNSTKLYDSIKKNLNEIYTAGELQQTTLIVCTDGQDYRSNIDLVSLLKYIRYLKYVNIIIVAINMTHDSTKSMKEIIKTAHFGKLLHTNDDIEKYGFDNISSTMSKVKEITLSGNYYKNIDYRKEFNF